MLVRSVCIKFKHASVCHTHLPCAASQQHGRAVVIDGPIIPCAHDERLVPEPQVGILPANGLQAPPPGQVLALGGAAQVRAKQKGGEDNTNTVLYWEAGEGNVELLKGK